MVHSRVLFSGREERSSAASFSGFRQLPEFLTGAAAGNRQIFRTGRIRRSGRIGKILGIRKTGTITYGRGHSLRAVELAVYDGNQGGTADK